MNTTTNCMSIYMLSVYLYLVCKEDSIDFGTIAQWTHSLPNPATNCLSMLNCDYMRYSRKNHQAIRQMFTQFGVVGCWHGRWKVEIKAKTDDDGVLYMFG